MTNEYYSHDDCSQMVCGGTKQDVFARIISFIRHGETLDNQVALKIKFSKSRAFGKFTRMLSFCEFKLDVKDFSSDKRPMVFVKFSFRDGDKRDYHSLVKHIFSKLRQHPRNHTKTFHDMYVQTNYFQNILVGLRSNLMDVERSAAVNFSTYLVNLHLEFDDLPEQCFAIVGQMLCSKQHEVVRQGLVCLRRIQISKLLSNEQAQFFISSLRNITIEENHTTFNLHCLLRACLQLLDYAPPTSSSSNL